MANPKPRNLPELQGVMPTAKGPSTPSDSSMTPKNSHSVGPKKIAAGIMNGDSFKGGNAQRGGSVETFTDSPDIKVTPFTPTMNDHPAPTKFSKGSGHGTGK